MKVCIVCQYRNECLQVVCNCGFKHNKTPILTYLIDDFKECPAEAQIIPKSRYDCNNFKYDNNTEEIVIDCPFDHVILPIPDYHLMSDDEKINIKDYCDACDKNCIFTNITKKDLEKLRNSHGNICLY